jgi:NAD-reducing hydrogenase small subunit
MTRARVATVSLAGCFGCHMSLLDIDERLVELLEVVEFHKTPLVDRKHFTERCALGLVEGGCANAENVEVLRAFREHCDVLVSVGDCATTGGIPALRNGIPLEECLNEAYRDSPSTTNSSGELPDDPELPLLLDRVYACHEVVHIDHFLPGCPPSADAFWVAIQAILAGRDPELPRPLLRYD